MAKKANKRSNRYPVGFQRDAVERMEHCEDIGKLAEELGVSRGALYLWKRKGEGLPSYRDAARRGHPAAADDPQGKKIATSLAERHLRRDLRLGVARPIDDPANVRVGRGEPGELLPGLGAEGSQ